MSKEKKKENKVSSDYDGIKPRQELVLAEIQRIRDSIIKDMITTDYRNRANNRNIERLRREGTGL